MRSLTIVHDEQRIGIREAAVGARKNYSFEKNQRAKAKAAKREAKREENAAAREEKRRQESGEAEQPADVDRDDDSGGEQADR